MTTKPPLKVGKAPETETEKPLPEPEEQNSGGKIDPYEELAREYEPEPEPEVDVDTGEPVVSPVGGDGLYTLSAFTEGAGKAFVMAGGFSGLQTLMHSPEQETFPGAMEAVYETIRETPSLHFMIKPGGKWIQRAFALGSFAIPVAAGCRVEIAERRKALKAANDNKASKGKEAFKDGPAVMEETYAGPGGEPEIMEDAA